MKKLMQFSLIPAVMLLTAATVQSSGAFDTSGPSPASSTHGTPASSSSSTITPEPLPQGYDARFVFFGSSDAYKYIVQRAGMPPLGNNDPGDGGGLSTGNNYPVDPAYTYLAEKDNANGILAKCGYSSKSAIKPKMAPIFITLAEWLVKQAVTWAIGEVEQTVQDEVNEHTATYSVTTSEDLSSILTDGKPSNLNKAKQVACYRYSLRGPSGSSDKNAPPTLLLDFIGSVHYDPKHPGVLTLIPVRLYTKSIFVKSNSNTAINMTLVASADQPSANQPRAVERTDPTVGAAKITDTDLNGTGYVYTTFPNSTSSLTEQIKIPSGQASADPVYFTLSITEIGDLSDFLAFLSKVTSSQNSKDLGTYIDNKINKWIDPKAAKSTSSKT